MFILRQSHGTFQAAAILVALRLATQAAAADEAGEFFESRVRPILHARCAECHGPAKQQGELRLDQRGHVLGDATHDGIVAPGNPGESRLIQVIRHVPDDTQMPPENKLPEAEIRILTEWVRRGAYWPPSALDGATGSSGIPRQADGQIDFVAVAQGHWGYRPIVCPNVPRVSNSAAAQTEVDRFLTVRLEAAGLSPAAPADRRTLIRRVTFDLLGVPPTFEEVEAFAADPRPDAYERLIDRLLASPLYGQRWGRHWLDVARYADTKGYVFTENSTYPFAYTYRDYVVQAFNEDQPFDRFVLEQLAADRLGLAEDDPALAALGYLTVGARFLNREPDIIDDRIDVVTRGLMGLTVACARCHDHKYDPIPTADYYSLYGVFASSDEPDELPLIGGVERTPGYVAYEAELAKRRQAAQDYVVTARQELLKELRERAGDYLMAVVSPERARPDGLPNQPSPPRDKLVRIWKGFLERCLRDDTPAFRPWKRLAQLPADEFSGSALALIDEALASAESLSPVELAVWQELRNRSPQSMLKVASIYGWLLAVAGDPSALRPKGEAAESRLSPPAADALLALLTGPGSVTDIPDGDNEILFERDNRDKLRALQRKVEEWQVESPDAPPRAMVLHDRERPVEPVIFLRGDNDRRGDRVPRQPPRILTGGESRPAGDGSGRLDLARLIVSPDNPLTARVLVNRVWEWHFGRGLVTSAGDFGVRSDPPTHPELLDWLAWQFVHTDGWSLKTLHRRIMLSAVYRQSAADRPDGRKADPENLLYWRANRRRLEFEPMRDALLAVAGRLDPALGGRPVDIEKSPDSGRRSLYARIDRNNFSPLLRTFDFPSPDATSPGRPLTTVPQQTLYALNAPFLRSIADSLANQAAAAQRGEGGVREATAFLYRRILSREPSAEEQGLAAAFLERHPDGLSQFAQALLLTNEFLFID